MQGPTRISKSFVIGVLLLLLIPVAHPVSFDTGISLQNSEEEIAYEVDMLPLERHWPVKVVFVGYDPSTINNESFIDELPEYGEIDYENMSVRHWVDYEVHYASDLYMNWTVNWFTNKSTVGVDNGSSLNETALSLMLEDPSTPYDIFVPRDGRSINATPAEKWINVNPYVNNDDQGWILYVLNLSQFDSPDHSTEHWFEYDHVDADSGSPVDWTQVGFDNILNTDVNPQFTGIGGRYNKYILDPSADQWYLRWAQQWYNDSLGPGQSWPEHYTMDLEDKMTVCDLDSAEGKLNLTRYLADYCSEVVTNLFVPSSSSGAGGFMSENAIGFGVSSVTIDVNVFSVDDTQDIEDFDWLTTENVLMNSLSHALPFTDLEILIDFQAIQTNAELNSTFYTTVNGTIVDGDSLLTSLISPHSEDTSHVVLNVTAFIGSDLAMVSAGTFVTGVGSNRTAIICKSWDRVFDNDEGQNRSGISNVILQEIGLLLGLNKTSEGLRFTPDFSRGVMGGLDQFGAYSTFEKSALWRMYLDQLEYSTRLQFIEDMESVPEDPRLKTRLGINSVIETFARTERQLQSLQPYKAWNSLLSISNWTRRILTSVYDTLRPEIYEWGFDRPSNWNESFFAWANVSGTGSALENVSFVVSRDGNERRHLLSYNGTLFTGVIPHLRANATYDVYIETFDWGMNKASGYHQSLNFYPPEPPPLDPGVTAPIVIPSSILLMGVVIAIARIYDKRINPSVE
ncbi:MAG: hypothetical protein RTU30_07015 [Candidatus Thorarchaeota archaeon]